MNDASGRRVISGSLRRVWLLLLIVFMSWGTTALSQNPAVLSVAPSDSLLSDADVGAGKFSVVVVYSETMDTGIRPTLSFSPDVAGTLSFADGVWSMTSVADDTFTATYDVADADVTVAGVDIAVDGARDTDGNPQTPDTQPDAFNVDTQNPPAPSIPDLDPGSDHGPSNADDVTNDNTPTFGGTAEENSTVKLSSHLDGSLGTTAASAGGSWTFTVPGGSALSDGTHAISARATDAAGNAGPVSAGLCVLIDTQEPSPPDDVGRSPANGEHANDTTPTFSWTAVPSDPGGSGVRDYRMQVIDSGLHIDKDAYPNDTDYTPATPLDDDAYTWKLYTRDMAGNYGGWGSVWTLAIDTAPPAVTEVTASDRLISDTDAGGTLTVTASFTEDMDTSTDPTLTFDPGLGSTLVWSSDGWTDSDTYWTTYTILDGGAGHDSVTIDVSGAKDLAENPQQDYAPENEFGIDTLNPTVGIAVGDSALVDDDVGVAAFTVTATFSESMNTAAAPALIFAPDPNTTLTNESGRWVPIDPPLDLRSRVYEWTHDIEDAGVLVTGIDVAVSGAEDEAGNVQDPDPKTLVDAFDIDTRNPTCSIAVGTTLVYDSDRVQEVTVTYDETMGASPAPTIGFLGTAGAWTSNADGAWNLARTVWTESFTVTDADEEATGVDVTAAGAQDAAGNAQVARTELGLFNVDTHNPSCEAITAGTAMIYDGHRIQEVTVRFDEPMSATPPPTIQFQTTTGSWTPGTGQWDGTRRIWTQSFTISDANEETQDVDVAISGARDAPGNTQVLGTLADAFDLDTRNPAVASVTSATPDGYYDEGHSINVTVSFSEAVTLSGGTLDVTLETGSADDVVSILPLGPAPSASTTYVVGSGDNNCDLDATGAAMNAGPLRDSAGNDAVISLPAATIADGSDISVDTTDPVVAGLDLPDGDRQVDGNCEIRISYSATLTDNCCLDAGDVAVLIEIISGGATLDAPAATIANQGGTRVNVSGSFTVGDLTSGPARVRVRVTGADCAGNVGEAEDTVQIIDGTRPVVSGLALPNTDQLVDGNCTITIPYSAIVIDNCCLDATAVSVVMELVAGANTAILDAPAATITNQGGVPNTRVNVSGSFTVRNLWNDPVRVRVRVNATDCNGNTATEASDTVTIADSTVPVIAWDTKLPASPQYVSADSCTISFQVRATVTDNCCISAGSVSVSISLTNGTLVHNVTAAQNGEEVVVAGTITVSALNGCPAVLAIRISATDCCGNAATQLSDSLSVYDQTTPAIHDLTVSRNNLVDGCCLATVQFSAYVTDNCYITPSAITITVTNPTDNAIVEFDRAEDTVFTQTTQQRVDLSGEIGVRCLRSCPAIVRVRIEARDCCGNLATLVESTADESDPDHTGHVYDVTPPEVQEDTDRIREDTPTRIYVLENDDDNCTRKWQGEPCRCGGVLRIYDIFAPPTYGTAAIEDELSHIRYAPFQDYRGPDEFTYRVIDACGNISAEATVRLEVVPKLVMADGTYATCRDEPVAFTLQATDPLVTEESVGEFQFTILDGPAHGVLTGDLGDLRYEDLETALVDLAYAPAAGFVGRDRIDVKFEDPYGESSTAVVDIDVIDCKGATSSLAVARGSVLPILLPASFPSADGTGLGGITLTAGDGTPLGPGVLEQVLSVLCEPSLGRCLLLLDTGPLSVASCFLTVPLGDGETVILELALEEGK